MAKLRHLTHEIVVSKRHLYSAESWCKEHFGDRWDIFNNPQGRWTVFWAGRDCPTEYRWCFAEEQDAAWFALRWMS